MVDVHGCGCFTLVVTASLFLPTASLLFVAVDAIRLLHLVWESNKAHCCFCGTAVLAGPGDRVADTSVSQPAGIAAIVALELPGGVDVTHLGYLCTIV